MEGQTHKVNLSGSSCSHMLEIKAVTNNRRIGDHPFMAHQISRRIMECWAASSKTEAVLWLARRPRRPWLWIMRPQPSSFPIASQTATQQAQTSNLMATIRIRCEMIARHRLLKQQTFIRHDSPASRLSRLTNASLTRNGAFGQSLDKHSPSN